MVSVAAEGAESPPEGCGLLRIKAASCLGFHRPPGKDDRAPTRDKAIGVVQRKPGALRNGAPFDEMPEALQILQRHLLRHEGGDRVMAQVLAAVASQGLEAVLVAVELALESGNISGEHVLNVVARLQSPALPPTSITSHLRLNEEPQANVQRYDHLRQTTVEVDHVD